MIPVAGTVPKLLIQDDRRGDLDIAVALVHLPPVVDQRVLEHHALGQEEREAGALVHDREQAQLLAELAVVALLCLLQHGQVGVEVGLLFKRRAVNALEHLVLFTAAPVCARNAHELRVFELTGRGDVRAGAQVNELALPVEADDGVLREILNELNLVRLALLLHECDGLRAGQLKTLEREVFLRDLFHLLLDGGQIVRRERLGRIEIVIEPVVDGRPDGELDLRMEALDRLRKHVRTGVAVGPAAVRVGKGVELDGVVALNGAERIAVYAVDGAGKRGLGEARADGGGDIQTGHAVLKLALPAVRERDNHTNLLLFVLKNKNRPSQCLRGAMAAAIAVPPCFGLLAGISARNTVPGRRAVFAPGRM